MLDREFLQKYPNHTFKTLSSYSIFYTYEFMHIKIYLTSKMSQFMYTVYSIPQYNIKLYFPRRHEWYDITCKEQSSPDSKFEGLSEFLILSLTDIVSKIFMWFLSEYVSEPKVPGIDFVCVGILSNKNEFVRASRVSGPKIGTTDRTKTDQRSGHQCWHRISCIKEQKLITVRSFKRLWLIHWDSFFR